MKPTATLLASVLVAVAFVGCGGGDDHDHDDGHHHHDGHAHGASATATVSTVSASVKTDGELVPGQPAKLVLTLKNSDGQALTVAGLSVVHTQAIHLLINDETLTDYHHEHPVPTGVPGQYAFTFTPQKPGANRVWADVVPKATGSQEYAIADVGTPSGALPETMPESVLKRSVDGLQYALTFDNLPLKTGEAALGSIKILKADGSPFEQLEPVMGAFAHIVAFYPDRETLAHVHPMGAEPTLETDRGTGALEFHLMPEKPGMIRLFLQTQIGGSQRFIPFLVTVTA